MSTKCTIVHSDDFHVYTDIIDELTNEDLVYVELNRVVCVEFSTWEGSATTMTVGLRRDVLEKLVFSYAEKRTP